MGTSWISRKGGTVEKKRGGWSRKGVYHPPNQLWIWLASLQFLRYYHRLYYTVTNNLDQIQSLIYRLLYKTPSFLVLSFLKICQHTKCFALILDSEKRYLVYFCSTHHTKHWKMKNYMFHHFIFSKIIWFKYHWKELSFHLFFNNIPSISQI